MEQVICGELHGTTYRIGAASSWAVGRLDALCFRLLGPGYVDDLACEDLDELLGNPEEQVPKTRTAILEIRSALQPDDIDELARVLLFGKLEVERDGVASRPETMREIEDAFEDVSGDELLMFLVVAIRFNLTLARARVPQGEA